MNYAITATGLFHRLDNPTLTMCGQRVAGDEDMPPMVPTSDEQAVAWLKESGHDMCKRCAEAWIMGW